jgi:membrane-bound lytic murein transglycosylase D
MDISELPPVRPRPAAREPIDIAALEPLDLPAEEDEEDSSALETVSPEPVDSSESPGVAAGAEPSEPISSARRSEAALAADPSDYTVDEQGRIEVQAAETLGHYADWLNLETNRLRQLNHLRYGQNVQIGSKLRLDFSRVSSDQFEARRLAYHRELQDDFFEHWEISGTKLHVMARGESVWELSEHTYRVPLWLLRQYNPDVDLSALDMGAQIKVPLLRAHRGEDDEPEAAQPESAAASLPQT